MSKPRLLLRRLIFRFLSLFSEVRLLRRMETAKDGTIRGLSVKILDLERENAHLSRELEKAKLAIEDEKHALGIMTEARLNADRMVEGIRAQMDTLREISEREINSLKQTADWVSLECGHRQIFGTAPQPDRPKEPQTEPTEVRLTARRASQMLTQRFFEEAMARAKAGEALPSSDGPEYSSAERFSSNSYATNEG